MLNNNDFIEIQDNGGTVYTVNPSHIVKMYKVTYDAKTFTRVIFTAGGGMIDSPLTTENIIKRIKVAPC